jgi:hypothetical protein
MIAGAIGLRFMTDCQGEHCLAYRLVRYEWQQFRTELVPIATERLTKWIRMNSRALPFSPDLPDEPEPLQTL